MDDTRHVASWIGGQEALHDRVLTLDEALAAVQAVDAPAVQRLAGQLFRDDVLRLAAVAPGALPARARGPAPVAGMTATLTRPDTATGRSVELVLAHAHLRLGSLALARTELETLAGLGRLDTPGLVDLAEVRWRTGDLAGAGEAAAVALRGDEEHPVALLIAAEAAAALGRPSESRRLAARAMANATGSIDAIFAGMPRSAAWPPDADEPPPTAPTLFDRAPETPGQSQMIEPATGAASRPPFRRLPAAAVVPAPGPMTLGLWEDDVPEEPGARDLPEPARELEAGRTALVAGQVRRGHPAFRARAAARPGARPGRPRGDGGLTRLRPADGPRRCIPAGGSRGRGQGGISRRRARRAARAPPPLANEARQDRADRRRRCRGRGSAAARGRVAGHGGGRPRRGHRRRRRAQVSADAAGPDDEAEHIDPSAGTAGDPPA